MSYQQKKALEIAIRDAMDGMEALASLYAYRRLPEDLEILGIGDAPEFEPKPFPSLSTTAEVVYLAEFRRSDGPRTPPRKAETTQKIGQIY